MKLHRASSLVKNFAASLVFLSVVSLPFATRAYISATADFNSFEDCTSAENDAATCCAKDPSWPECKAPSSPSNPTGQGAGSTGNSTKSSGTTAGCPDKFVKDPSGLCLPPSDLKGGWLDVKNSGQLIEMVIKFLLYGAGIISVIMIIVGGYQYIVSGGNSEQAEKGKNTLINAVIGLAIVMLSYLIVSLVSGFITKGPQ